MADPVASPMALGWAGENETQWAVSESSPGQSPGDRMGQRQLELPQGKEEICKEEVVESQSEVAESRPIDL